MKFLIFVSCVLAIASANIPYYYGSPYAQHVPLIDNNGVPVETPEVQAAKATHFAAHAAAQHGVHLHVGYAGHGVPAITADGRPLDTPEVQLAKAAHFIAYNQAAYRNAAPYGAVAEGPIDTPEVQIAKAAHFAAHAEAKSRSGHLYRKRRAVNYAYPQALPQIGHNGVPLDTPEVQAAKASHYAALSQAASRNNLAPAYSGQAHHGQAYSGQAHPGQAYSNEGYTGQTYYGPYHIPVIGPNGVPVETPEVQAAKADHYAAVSKAGGSSYSAPYSAPGAYGGGGPVDTPEVQAAKAAHFAAHQANSGHRYY